METENKTAENHTLSRLIREARERKYKTAKQFWEEHEDVLKVSYPHYSTVETGKSHPDINLAISISNILKLDLRTVCHLWAKDQMPNAQTKGFFDPVPGLDVSGITTRFKDSLDEFYVFTEKQTEAFNEHPFLWDVLSFIMAFGHARGIS
ncbi:MAG: helix-turn-helix transcriptional regulator [Bdellovibrionota bacterium]